MVQITSFITYILQMHLDKKPSCILIFQCSKFPTTFISASPTLDPAHMFAHLFGWRKASKCRTLVNSAKVRLKLLKKKKRCLVNQLRNDVAHLLGYGLDQIAFQRVEQLIKDETTIEVYDLLDKFCEVIIINLPYIRKHKDCPKDINEAASTLIFSSARIGELPELISMRKLFEERYGQRFVMAALKLLPGNIVNFQMIEKIYPKKVPDDEKYQYLHEIAASGIHSGQYLLDYKRELLNDQATEGSCIQMPTNDRTSNEDSKEMSESTVPRKPSSEKMVVRSSRKTRNGRRKRSRRRRSSISKESRIITDTECAAYYGESDDTSSDNTSKSHAHHRKKILVQRSSKSHGPKTRNSFQDSDLKHRYRAGEGIDRLIPERTMSMPLSAAKRRNKNSTCNGWRSISFPLEQPHCGYSDWHGTIHPKLPDYDELTAKFVVLKRENLYNNQLGGLKI